jgi:hypothetical protein
MHEYHGDPVLPVLMPATAGEEADPRLDLEQLCLVPVGAEAARACPTSECLGVPAGK